MRRRTVIATAVALGVGAAVTLGFASDWSRVGRALAHRESARAAAHDLQEGGVGPGAYCRIPPRTEVGAARIAVGQRTPDVGTDSAALFLLQGQSTAAPQDSRDSVCTGVAPGPQGFRAVVP
jgi:hypothetical protein